MENRELEDVMHEAEGWFDAWLQGELAQGDWRDMRGEARVEIAGRKCLCYWRADKKNLWQPRIIVRNGRDSYTIKFFRTICPDVVLYEWQCWDAYGLSGDIDKVCAARGRVIFP